MRQDEIAKFTIDRSARLKKPVFDEYAGVDDATKQKLIEKRLDAISERLRKQRGADAPLELTDEQKRIAKRLDDARLDAENKRAAAEKRAGAEEKLQRSFDERSGSPSSGPDVDAARERLLDAQQQRNLGTWPRQSDPYPSPGQQTLASTEGQSTTMLASQQDPALSYMEKLGLLKAKHRPGLSEAQEAAAEAALKQNVAERSAIAGLRAEQQAAAAQAAKESAQEAIERASAFRRSTQFVDLADPASAPIPTGRTSASQLPNVGVAVQAVTKADPFAFSQQDPTTPSGQQMAGTEQAGRQQPDTASALDPLQSRDPFGGGTATDAVAQPKTVTGVEPATEIGTRTQAEPITETQPATVV